MFFDLASNEIGNNGLSILSQSLKVNCSLEKLLLNDNFITELGLKDLCESLEKNSILKELSIG